MKLLFNPRGMSFDFTVGDWRPCEGVQKIAGFSRGWHHSNSIRLGYNRDTETSPVRLFMYAYINGKLIDPKECILGEFEVGSKLGAELRFDKRASLGIIDSPYDFWPSYIKSVKVPYKTLPLGYTLHPYAEQDHTGKRLDFNVKLTNVKYW